MQSLLLFLILSIYRIDVMLPMSGPLSPIGRDFFDGMKMGLGRTSVEIHVWDTKGNPGKVYEAASKVIDANTSLIVGPLTSLNMRSLLRVVEDVEIPVISPLARDLTLIDEYDYYFSYLQKYYLEMKEEIRFTINVLGYYNFAFVFPRTSFGYSLNEEANKFATMFGANVVATIFYDSTATDFSDIVDYLNGLDVEAIFIPVCDDGSYILAGQIRASTNFTPIMGLDGWSKRAISRGLGTLDKLLIASLPIDYKIEIQRESSLRRFEEAFNDIFGHPPSLYNMLGYDTGKILRILYQKKALESPESAYGALNELGIYHGLTGDILFGRDERFITFYLVKFGKIQKLREEDYGYFKVSKEKS